MGFTKLAYLAAIAVTLLLMQPVAAATLRDVFGAFVNLGRDEPAYDVDGNGVVNFGDIIALLQDVLGLGFDRITCSSDADCGTASFGSPFCDGSNVMRNYTEYLCLSPGTIASSCDTNTTPTFQETCAFGCAGGNCLSEPAGDFTCESADPGMILQSYTLPYNPNYCGPYGSSDCAVWGYEDSGGNPVGVFVLYNSTGGDILITDAVQGYEAYDGAANRKFFPPGFINGVYWPFISVSNSVAVAEDANISLEKIYLNLDRFCPEGCLVDDYVWPSTHSFSLTYSDEFDVNTSFEVVCQNFPPTS